MTDLVLIRQYSVFLPYRLVSNLQRDIHITSLAFNVGGIERIGIPAFQDAALAARFAIVQAFPGFCDIGLAFFLGGFFYLRRLHGY